jgi:hypothetical protein
MRERGGTSSCPEGCPRRAELPGSSYAYLLGQYLGDGYIVEAGARRVHRLFISCCADYPGIIRECEEAIGAVMPGNSVGRRRRPGMTDLNCYSKHWPCLFPQCGRGKKHERAIRLERWQEDIALAEWPEMFIRGLIHSDGSRFVNKIKAPSGKTYEYPRYTFCNHSADIRSYFYEVCKQLGIECRRMNTFNISVARKESVAKLEVLVGMKY